MVFLDIVEIGSSESGVDEISRLLATREGQRDSAGQVPFPI
jgi:hypothetical protein